MRPVRHIELELPKGVSYEAGDHLGVIPHNSAALVARVTRRFDLDPDAWIRLDADEAAHRSCRSASGSPSRTCSATTSNCRAWRAGATSRRCSRYTEYPWSRAELERLLDRDTYRSEILQRRLSVLDLLEAAPDLPTAVRGRSSICWSPLAPRYYSISSSSRVQPDACSITVGALVGEARSGTGTFQGTCSNYLLRAGRRSGGARLRPGHVEFVPAPERSEHTGADDRLGHGMAPFRGFLQERMALKQTGTRLGPGLLVFGCRHPQSDHLYGDELAQLAAPRTSSSPAPTPGCPALPRVYVQDRLRQMGEQVMGLLDDGAVGYVCGATAMADGVRDALIELRTELRGAGPRARPRHGCSSWPRTDAGSSTSGPRDAGET